VTDMHAVDVGHSVGTIRIFGGSRATSTSCLTSYLLSILGVITGDNSFRAIEIFIKVHRRQLNDAFGLRWKRAPAHTAIQDILQGLDPQAVEQAFLDYAAILLDAATDPSRRTISIDGKILRRSVAIPLIMSDSGNQVLGEIG